MMTLRQNIKRKMLKALLAADGVPMPDESLTDHVRVVISPAPANGDIDAARNELETEALISGLTDNFTKEKSWTLTTNGQHVASKLP